MTRSLRTYDHRLRELVRQTGDVTIATSAGVPRSTASGWLRRPDRVTVTLDALSLEQQGLQTEVLRLQRRVEKLQAVARILVAVLRVLDIDLGHHRIPNTVAVLLEACQGFETGTPMVLADGGVENFNGGVDELVQSGLLRRVLAMTELRFSNSMIEAWWRTLKHQWLFLNTLDSVATVQKLVTFYVKEHNERLPHSAFRGQTPDEMYLGEGDDVPDDLESSRKAARKERIAVNRALSCAACEANSDSDAA